MGLRLRDARETFVAFVVGKIAVIVMTIVVEGYTKRLSFGLIVVGKVLGFIEKLRI